MTNTHDKTYLDRAAICYFKTNGMENLGRIIKIGDDIRYFVKSIIDKKGTSNMSEPADKIIDNIVKFETRIAGENKSEYVHVTPKDVMNFSNAFLDLE